MIKYSKILSHNDIMFPIILHAYKTRNLHIRIYHDKSIYIERKCVRDAKQRRSPFVARRHVNFSSSWNVLKIHRARAYVCVRTCD